MLDFNLTWPRCPKIQKLFFAAKSTDSTLDLFLHSKGVLGVVVSEDDGDSSNKHREQKSTEASSLYLTSELESTVVEIYKLCNITVHGGSLLLRCLKRPWHVNSPFICMTDPSAAVLLTPFYRQEK